MKKYIFLFLFIIPAFAVSAAAKADAPTGNWVRAAWETWAADNGGIPGIANAAVFTSWANINYPDGILAADLESPIENFPGNQAAFQKWAAKQVEYAVKIGTLPPTGEKAVRWDAAAWAYYLVEVEVNDDGKPTLNTDGYAIPKLDDEGHFIAKNAETGGRIGGVPVGIPSNAQFLAWAKEKFPNGIPNVPPGSGENTAAWDLKAWQAWAIRSGQTASNRHDLIVTKKGEPVFYIKPFLAWARDNFYNGIPALPLTWVLADWETYGAVPDGIDDLPVFIAWANDHYRYGIPVADLENPIEGFPGDQAAFKKWAADITEYKKVVGTQPQGSASSPPPPTAGNWVLADWNTYAGTLTGGIPGVANVEEFIAWANEKYPDGIPVADLEKPIEGFPGDDLEKFKTWAATIPEYTETIGPLPPKTGNWVLADWNTYAGTLTGGIPGVANVEEFIAWANEKYPDGIPVADLEKPIEGFPGDDLEKFKTWAATIPEYTETIGPLPPKTGNWVREDWNTYAGTLTGGIPGVVNVEEFIAWANEKYPDGIPVTDLDSVTDFPGDQAAFKNWTATIPEYTETIGPLPPKTEPLIAPLPKKITPQRSSNRLPA
ncbi:MAG: hypothetical protein LBH00_11315, partial [Planctomycetaceae bacterium]|nr:hypothetical protein [Planctomycetaceae bacterium]